MPHAISQAAIITQPVQIKGRWGAAIAAPAALFFALTISAQAQSPGADAVQRGQYVFNAAGCLGCHTDAQNPGAPLAGGRALKTPFGTFYGPNITPDPIHGIGRWTEADLRRALHDGVRADGAQLFPVFPFTSFTKMTDADIADLWAYLRSVPAAAVPNKPHDVAFPFNLRFVQRFWKWMNFSSGVYRPDPAKPADVQRGAYVVEALGHCGECHTPRNIMGGMTRSMAFAGTRTGPEGGRVPNITPDPDTGIGKWSEADLLDLLKSGMTRDGDSVGGAMGEVIKNTTSKLTDEDVRAMIAYLRSVPPIRNQVRSQASN